MSQNRAVRFPQVPQLGAPTRARPTPKLYIAWGCFRQSSASQWLGCKTRIGDHWMLRIYINPPIARSARDALRCVWEGLAPSSTLPKSIYAEVAPPGTSTGYGTRFLVVGKFQVVP